MDSLWPPSGQSSPSCTHYFLLAHLSFAGLCFTSVTVPKMLANSLGHACSTSLAGCPTRMYFFALGVTDGCLLAAITHDRYVAIRHPLHYAARMSQAVCTALVGTACQVSYVHSLTHVLLVAHLSLCAFHQVLHLSCDHRPLLRLSRSDTRHIRLLVFTEGAAVVVPPFLAILASYGAVAAAVLRLPSASGRLRAVSTCGSHLALAGLFHGTVITVYLQPTPWYEAERVHVATVMYAVVTLMLNPVICSLPNYDVQGAHRALSTGRRLSAGDSWGLDRLRHPQ